MYFRASYSDLVTLLGEPNAGSDGYKVSTEWCVTYSNQTYSIYDYKETSLYDEEMPTVKVFRGRDHYDWHVGARENASSFITAMETALNNLHKE